MRLTRGLRGGGSLSLLSCSCSSTSGLSLPASTYSRAKGVCLFSFIVPELDPATYRMAAPANKTWKRPHGRRVLRRSNPEGCESAAVVAASALRVGERADL